MMSSRRRVRPRDPASGAPEGGQRALEAALPRYLKGRRWFRGKARTIRSTRVIDWITVSGGAFIAVVEVTYEDGKPERYTLPVALEHRDSQGEKPRSPRGEQIKAFGRGRNASVLLDAVLDEGFRSALLGAAAHGRRLPGSKGHILGAPLGLLRRARADGALEVPSRVLEADQSNTCIVYGSRFILKLYRRLDEGVSLDLEIGRFLEKRAASFPITPPLAGFLEYRRAGREPATVAVIQAFVKNRGSAWELALDSIGRFLETAQKLERAGSGPPTFIPPEGKGLPSTIVGISMMRKLGPFLRFLGAARLLGMRTAEMHRELAPDSRDPAFAPEPMTRAYQRSLVRSARRLTRAVLDTLAAKLGALRGAARRDALRVLDSRTAVERRFDALLERTMGGQRTRHHGDYHLGQVLFTGSDFLIIDFEGEPGRSPAERRVRASPLKDVAGMLRSFHYAAREGLRKAIVKRGAALEGTRAAREKRLEPWVEFWRDAASRSFLDAYLGAAAGEKLLSADPRDTRVLLDAHLLEKAVYELGYELNNRPAWVAIPLRGILSILES